MTPLSPAAQAVDIAIYGPGLGATRRQIAAAALRAAVDQVVPDEPYCFEDDSLCEYLRRTQRQETRAKFLAIAAELDSGSTTPAES